jgi:hypothetical protein
LGGVVMPLGIVSVYLAVSLFKNRPTEALIISLNGGHKNGNAERVRPAISDT